MRGLCAGSNQEGTAPVNPLSEPTKSSGKALDSNQIIGIAAGIAGVLQWWWWWVVWGAAVQMGGPWLARHGQGLLCAQESASARAAASFWLTW